MAQISIRTATGKTVNSLRTMHEATCCAVANQFEFGTLLTTQALIAANFAAVESPVRPVPVTPAGGCVAEFQAV